MDLDNKDKLEADDKKWKGELPTNSAQTEQNKKMVMSPKKKSFSFRVIKFLFAPFIDDLREELATDDINFHSVHARSCENHILGWMEYDDLIFFVTSDIVNESTGKRFLAGLFDAGEFYNYCPTCGKPTPYGDSHDLQFS